MNLKPLIFAVLFAGSVLAFVSHKNPDYAYAFSNRQENCLKCHSLTEGELKPILEKSNLKDAKILKIQVSPLKGLWEVAFDDGGRRGLIYVDFSKKYVIAGQIVEVNAAVDRTRERIDELNKDRRINPAGVPLKGALVVGSNSATRKVIVFTDPD